MESIATFAAYIIHAVEPREIPGQTSVLDTTTGLIIGSNRMKMDMGHVREATLFVAVI